jgi:hypothetical protein
MTVAHTEASEYAIVSKLNELWRGLLKNKKIRFYMCTDLIKLSELNAIGCKRLDLPWMELFPRSNEIFNSNEPFTVQPTWKLRKEKVNAVNNNHCLSNEADQSTSANVFASSPKKDYIINLASTESSFLRLVASSCLNSYEHPDYASVLVLFEYFCQTEVKILQIKFIS